MKMPGTFDSKFGLTFGMSTPRCSLPKTSVMASTGHAARQAPWPMQSVGLTSAALRRTMPSTWCPGISGQAATHDPQPMHVAVSMTGCSDGASSKPASRLSSSTAALARCWARRLRTYTSQITTSGVA